MEDQKVLTRTALTFFLGCCMVCSFVPLFHSDKFDGHDSPSVTKGDLASRPPMPHVDTEGLLDDGSLYYDVIAEANETDVPAATADYAYECILSDADNEQVAEEWYDAVNMEDLRGTIDVDYLDITCSCTSKGASAWVPVRQEDRSPLEVLLGEMSDYRCYTHPACRIKLNLYARNSDDAPLLGCAYALRLMDADGTPIGESTHVTPDEVAVIPDEEENDQSIVLSPQVWGVLSIGVPNSPSEGDAGSHEFSVLDSTKQYVLRMEWKPAKGDAVIKDIPFTMRGDQFYFVSDTGELTSAPDTHPGDTRCHVKHSQNLYETSCPDGTDILVYGVAWDVLPRPRRTRILYDPNVHDDTFSTAMAMHYPDGFTPSDAEFEWMSLAQWRAYDEMPPMSSAGELVLALVAAGGILTLGTIVMSPKPKKGKKGETEELS